jgi:hypothetical protein
MNLSDAVALVPPAGYHHAVDKVEHNPLFCQRCGTQLRPGEGNFYVVRIEAFADPAPPNLTEADFARDIEAEIDRLLEQMRGMSQQELMDQVYRRVTLHLCGLCYRTWIEDPTGHRQ